jgi:hypothetical protein
VENGHNTFPVADCEVLLLASFCSSIITGGYDM